MSVDFRRCLDQVEECGRVLNKIVNGDPDGLAQAPTTVAEVLELIEDAGHPRPEWAGDSADDEDGTDAPPD